MTSIGLSPVPRKVAGGRCGAAGAGPAGAAIDGSGFLDHFRYPQRRCLCRRMAARASGDAVLWLLDASAAVTVQRARQEAADLRQMLDGIPLPVWRRGPYRTLVDCNRAYASALDTTADLVVAEGREFAPGGRPGECRHVVIGGSRRLVEIGEVPCSTGGTIGFACDRPIARPPRRSRGATSTRTPRYSKPSAPSSRSTAPSSRSIFDAAFASMWGTERTGSLLNPRSRKLWNAPGGPSSPRGRRFPGIRVEKLGPLTSVVRPEQDRPFADGRTLPLSISPIHLAASLRLRGRQ